METKMAYERKEGQGSIFGNKDKKSDSHPDFTGEALWRGEVIRIALWKKRDKNDKTWLSVKISEPYKKAESQEQARPAARPAIDDDLPF
jgi:uncharacterized protein (DUF736 family)